MNVSPNEPFTIIYSMFEHEYLGYLFEPFVVQLNAKGEVTLQTQNIWSKNAKEFGSELDSADFELIKLMDESQQEVVNKKFNNKKTSAVDFFLRVFDKNKPDKVMQETIGEYGDKIRAKILPLLLKNKKLFLMSPDGDAVRTEVQIMPEPTSILFHFMRNESNTHYFPTMKHAGQKLEFSYKNALIINNEPGWMLLENHLYHFEKQVDGKKIRPFLRKKFIEVPKNLEVDYYQKFVTPLVKMFDVHAKGFEIKTERFEPQCLILVTVNQKNTEQSLSIFDQIGSIENQNNNTEKSAIFELFFEYGDKKFKFDSFAAHANVKMEKTADSFLFHKVIRNLAQEKQMLIKLQELGINFKNGFWQNTVFSAFEWLESNFETLKSLGIKVQQNLQDTKRYFLGQSTIDLSISEKMDWFDIEAKVLFGEFEIPFLKLKNAILNGQREYILPNGMVAIIPELWFTKYSELLAFAEKDPETGLLTLQKHHLGIVNSLEEESLARVIINRKLAHLANFEGIETVPLPKGFVGTLRPYQKAGYDWMHFLKKYKMGGCLADDMGLGKTIQTLAFLQSQKEEGIKEPSLLILPTSLLYNWEIEAKKFTPKLKVLLHLGSHRTRDNEVFNHFDLIITSYGIARIDMDVLSQHRFNYAILDESQSIKNATSLIAQAVMQLNTAHRLILTGTPLENSTMDLWTQMTFANPGLLGSQGFFRNNYQLPIEKRNDVVVLKKLQRLIKPFILRRNKSQVAADLPPKMETIQYCDMTEEQEEMYEKTKSYLRNTILSVTNEHGKGTEQNQMVLLAGLTKLRQIANHPKMVEEDFEGSSGKMNEILEKLREATQNGHKVLVFSQFVKHLTLLKNSLDIMGITYAYLDGSTTNRQKEVDQFQNNNEIQLFLISLKAGGVGLNLTAADYVFILDPWWNPAAENQAIDRAHRIGQTKTVFIYKMITKNTVEEKILALQKNKLKLATELIANEESFVKSLSKDDILALLD